MRSTGTAPVTTHALVGVTALLITLALVGCATSENEIAVIHEPLRVCAEGETLDGIDVSHHQGSIDWDAVAADGISYAFIRVSDGSYLDRRFEENWAEARRVGILRGAYQFFRPGRDATQQANILLDRMGPLEANDLPPVLDVEDDDGYSAAHIRAGVREWMERVESVTGLRPIIYTGYYFWRDEVGAPSEWNDHPLWIAQYGRTCPTIPDEWASWAFWQTSETGRVDGVSTAVDTDLFNGSRADLLALTGGGVVCGDGRCDGDEIDTCPEDCPSCQAIPAEGAVIDETSLCFETEGPERYIRSVSEGYDGGLLWTYGTSNSYSVVAGTWHLDFDLPGWYRLEVYTDGEWADSVEADYEIHHAGETDVVEADQTAVDGWLDLGDFEFAAGDEQYVFLGDNTGEGGWLDRRVVFDAIRLTAIDEDSEPEPEPEPPYDNWIGGECRDDADCLTGLCLDEGRYGYPGGMCTERCDLYCPDQEGEPTTFCIAIEGEGYCFSRESTSHYPGTGCRPDYRSTTMPRISQSWVRRDVCVPDVSVDGVGGGGTVSNPIPEEDDGFEPFLPDAMTDEMIPVAESGCSAAGSSPSTSWLIIVAGLGAFLLRRRRG